MNVVREKNISQPMIGQLNINSIRNNFYFLEYEASKHLDITDIRDKNWWVISLTQFLLDGFSGPYRLCCCANGGGKPLHVRYDVSSCLLAECKLQDNIKCQFIEINIRKKKWPLSCPYDLNKKNI